MKLIVGLGNPGAEYAGTRHNAGFEVIEILAKRHLIAVTKRNFRTVYGDGMIFGQRVILARPMTYMNLSGESVSAMARFYKIEPENIVVVLDEIALPPGRLRLRYQGSAGGHNGLANILELLHTEAVPRIRIGIGTSRSGQLIGHVLSLFPREEHAIMQEAFELAADAVECALAEGFIVAMNRFNVKEKTRKTQEAGKKEEEHETVKLDPVE